ncbi:MAG TPA: CocE/NonD family hydrolase [Gemmatimonadales bacterium]|nr:CocE/NonD family hydrolase [Gemmatimonadales bacterium]
MRSRAWWAAAALAAAVPALLAAQQPAAAAAPAAPQVSQPAYRVWIDFNQRVKMRDGVELSADVYRPDTAGRFPVVLSRTPYTKTGSLRAGRDWASRGYVFVAMDVRGRGDSDGEWVPYRNDGRDGYDAVEWCAAQPWSTGKVGTIGGSYNGRIQWFTAVLQPPHLAAMIAMVTPSDPFVEWPTGLPLPMDISWYHFTAGHLLQNMDAVDWSAVQRHLPMLTMDSAAGRPNPYWREEVRHAQLSDWWEPVRYQNKYDRVEVPVLHISGWYDDEQVGTPLNYIGMTTRGPAAVRARQHLLMGPWPHAINSTAKLGAVDFGPTGQIDLTAVQLRWFDYWLKGVDNGVMAEPPVRIFVMGTNAWVSENEWPMARTQWTRYYLHSGGRAASAAGDGALSTAVPAREPPDAWTDDPANPVTFITEPSFAQIGGPDDYRQVEQRPDVLVYTSDSLTRDLEVCGPIRARLFASSDGRDTDFMVKLLDVWPDGYVERLIDGMVRARFRDGMDRPSPIEPGRIYGYDVDVWNTCQTFRPGHRIRVEVASTAFPKYDVNPNTGETLGQTTTSRVARQAVFHDREHASYVMLPVVPN